MSQSSNERRMAEIARRLSSSTLTQEPWQPTNDGGVRRGGVLVLRGGTSADADFVAHARDDVPWLVARVRQLERAFFGGGNDVDLDPISEE